MLLILVYNYLCTLNCSLDISLEIYLEINIKKSLKLFSFHLLIVYIDFAFALTKERTILQKENCDLCEWKTKIIN